MSKRFLALALTMLMLLPALIYAANMQVTSSCSPVNGGTIAPQGIKTSAVLLNYSVTTNAGFSRTSVTLNGSPITPIAGHANKYAVPYTSGAINKIIANFQVQQYSITVGAFTNGSYVAQGGSFSAIAAGASRSLAINAGTGYMIASLTDNGTAVPAAVGLTAYTYSLASISASHTIAATFTVIPTATVYAGIGQIVALANDGGASHTALSGSVTNTSAPATSTSWTVFSSPAGSNPTFTGGTTLTPTFNFDKQGIYVVKLSALVSGRTFTSAGTTIEVKGAGTVASNACIVCHAGSAAVTDYPSSIHALNTSSTCAKCHQTGVFAQYTAHPFVLTAASVSPTTFQLTSSGALKYSGKSKGDIYCTVCHRNIPGVYDASIPHTTTGLTTTCAACHSASDAHGIKDIQALTTTMTNAQCVDCHSKNVNSIDPAVTTAYSAAGSVHSGATCVACHVTNGTGIHTGTVTVTCTACHTNATGLTLTAWKGVSSCTGCHNNTTDIHAVTDAGANCVACHGAAITAHIGIFNNASGVRQITGLNGEFGEATSKNNANGYRSHHIYNGSGVAPDNAQCIVCHLEGKVAADLHTIVLDTNYHMKDNKTHLRGGNGTNYAWNPAHPDHTAMDNFCMACHNANGTSAVYANISGALLASAKVQANITANAANRPSAKNPFGDRLTNDYDGLTRTQVVAVYEQFDPSNTSHHAVRAKKYTTRTRSGATYVDANGTTGSALFTQYSGAVQGNIHPKTGATVNSVFGYFGDYSTAYANSGFGPLSPGTRKTIYEATLFTSAFRTLDGDQLGDDSTLHCGDCHTVGQWKNGSAKNADGTLTSAIIGAHGSKNEYMLRTSNGTDALMAANTAAIPAVITYGANNQATNLNGGNGTLVCYLCHKQDAYMGNAAYFKYSDPLTGATSGKLHIGVGSGDCLGSPLNTTGQKTYGTRVGAIGQNKSVFGIVCLNCHGGNTQIFGGIHGNSSSYGNSINVGYKTYSTNGYDAVQNRLAGNGPTPGFNNFSATGTKGEHRSAQLTVVTRKPYRFAGGMSLKYSGGGSASRWETKAMSTIHREGCYNLQTSTTGTAQWSGNDGSALVAIDYFSGNGAAAKLPAVANGVADDLSTASNNGTSTGWGSCNHHSGSNTAGSNNASTRQIQRPLNY
jgi:hypothetical protein